jgi:hypothetical protein
MLTVSVTNAITVTTTKEKQMTKTLNITETSNSGFSVVLKQDVNTEYESVLFVEFFSTMRKAENCAKKLTKEFMGA